MPLVLVSHQGIDQREVEPEQEELTVTMTAEGAR